MPHGKNLSKKIWAQIQRFELVHPNIYSILSIYKLLEHVEEPMLQNQTQAHVTTIVDENPKQG